MLTPLFLGWTKSLNIISGKGITMMPDNFTFDLTLYFVLPLFIYCAKTCSFHDCVVQFLQHQVPLSHLNKAIVSCNCEDLINKPLRIPFLLYQLGITIHSDIFLRSKMKKGRSLYSILYLHHKMELIITVRKIFTNCQRFFPY